MVSALHVSKNLVVLVARVFLSLIFVLAGIQKILQFSEMSGMLVNIGLPSAEWLLIFAIIFELLGGLLLFFGWFARFGAFLLFVFVIVATFLFHSFWNFEGEAAMQQVYHFMKNLTILGGLLYVMAYGAGHFSFDRFRGKPRIRETNTF